MSSPLTSRRRTCCLFFPHLSHLSLSLLSLSQVRARARVTLVGSPLTHARFNRRSQGTYGPAIAAGKGTFPGQATPLPGLYRCGDSTNPGIGVPAVAASGALAANALMPLDQHLKLLDLIKM